MTSPASLVSKWGPDLLRSGWLAIPTDLLRHQCELGLDALDLAIVLQIASYWFTTHNLPNPSKATIAKSIGVDPRTVQRRISKLQRNGIINRGVQKRRGTSRYDLSGLIDKATKLVQQSAPKDEASR
jgi:hypothetical protein